MRSSLSPEQKALTEIEAAYSQLGLPGSEGQFIETTLGLDAMKRLLHAVSVPSVVSLLEGGLNCIRQGRSTEGLIFLALARERLTPDQVQLAVVLDTFIQGCGKYWQAQEALHQASKRFAEIDAEQQAQIAILEKLLPTLVQDRDTDSTLRAIPRTLKNSNYHQNMQSSLSSVEAVYPQWAHQKTVAQVDEASDALPALYITCFCRFEVRRLGQPIVLCSNRNGQAILRYLVAQPEHRATMDVLMAVMWPEDEPEVAHHKLQVAVSALRRSLNHGYVKDAGGGHILCKNGVYELNPLVPLQTDVEEFLEYYQAGRQSSGSTMADYYERACDLYTGPFLSEDLYADWSFIRRGQLSQVYLTMCNALAEYYLEAGRYEDAMRWIGAILKENRCDEAAHRQLMRAYAARGRRSDALRQYQLCARILAEELGAQPMPETISLFQAILNNENLPEDGTK
jgi:DNA-binding SARP family transcriptional activator